MGKERKGAASVFFYCGSIDLHFAKGEIRRKGKTCVRSGKKFSSYYFRISLTLACPMNLKLYPMDRQTCSLKIASCESASYFSQKKKKKINNLNLFQMVTPPTTSPTCGSGRTPSRSPRD